MKTNRVTMLSLAALLVAGCSQNEVTEVSPDAHPQVGFNVYTAAPNRGVDMTTSSMKDSPNDASKYGGFGIMGYYTGQKTFEEVKATVTPSFMHNQKVEWNATDNAWTYSPVKYWPNTPNDKISFFAYAPYETDYKTGAKTGVVVSEPTEMGIPSIKFSLKPEADLKKMVDLVVADQRDMSYNSVTNQGKISFKFEHTLSRISFKAQLNDGDFNGMDGTNSFVYITHMWIVGTDHSSSGNLSLINPGTTGNSNANSKFYTTAKWSELHWNYADAVIPKADFSLDNLLDMDAGITESNPTAGHSSSVTGIKITAASQGTNNAVPLFPDGQYLYLIPIGDNNSDASKNSGCAAGDIQIGFHYDVVTKDAANPNQYIASHGESVINLPAGQIKRKESYVYTVKINLHKIEISEATVTPWTDTSSNVSIQ